MADPNPDDLMALDPETVAPADLAVEDLRARLAVEENLVRTRAAQLTAVLAAEDTERAVSLVPTLLDRLVADDDHSVVLKATLTALVPIADDRPDALDGGARPLVPLLGHDLPLIRTFAARVVRPLAAEHPEWFVPHVGTLIDVLGREDHDLSEDVETMPGKQDPTNEQYRNMTQEIEQRRFIARGVAANLLLAVSETEPGALEGHVTGLIDLLDVEDASVVAASAGAIAGLAQETPSAAREATQPLCGCLDSPDDTVRARAVTALGFLGDPAAVEPLRAVADDPDADEDLRALAAETAGWLEGDGDAGDDGDR